MCRLPLVAAVAAALVALAPAASAASWSTSGGLPGGTVLALAVDAAAPAHAVAVVQGPEDSQGARETRLYETLDAGRGWAAGAAEVAGSPIDAATGVVVADGAVWISTSAAQGPCRGATAAGPFACASADGPFRSLVAVPGQPGTLLATTGRTLQRSVDGAHRGWCRPGSLRTRCSPSTRRRPAPCTGRPHGA